MKIVSVDEFSQEPLALLGTAQMERVLVTRNGKPVAVLFGIEFKDQEDYALERDDAFWQMIAERRKSKKTVPLEQLKKELGISGPARGSKRSRAARPTARTKKQ